MALVTGCSSGIGQECATALARRGWRVFAGLRDPSRASALDAARKELGDRGRNVEVVELDVTSDSSVDAALRNIGQSAGEGVDLLLHNAGVMTAGFFEDVDDAEFRRVMETNFFGVLRLTRAALPQMRARRHGRIVVMSSNAANLPQPLFSAYAASKWALEGWAETLAAEVLPLGIEIGIVQPGAYRTRLGENAHPVRPPDGPYEDLWNLAEPGLGEFSKRQRDPREVGEAVADLVERPRMRMRMRTRVGPDARLAGAALGVLTSEARAALQRRWYRFPGRRNGSATPKPRE